MNNKQGIVFTRSTGYLWALINAVGIDVALVLASIFATSAITYVSIAIAVAILVLVGQWFLLRIKIEITWPWIIISGVGWILSFGIIVVMYILTQDSLTKAVEQLGGVVDVMVFVIVALCVGPVVMVGMLIFADLRYQVLR